MTTAIDLTDEVIIVTGGGKGVGLGITKVFLEAGAHVLICGRSEPGNVPEVNGNKAEFFATDVRDADQVTKAAEKAHALWGRIDCLVNNAGGAPPVEAASVSPRFSEAIIQLNLTGPLHFSQAVNKYMQDQDDGGSIINIASVSALRPSPGTAAYGAAKAGILSLTQSLAMEWGPKVRVNSIICGLVATEQSHLHYGSEEQVKKIGAKFPLGRMADPEDIGNACLYLASSLAGYVSGAKLEVHGGGERPIFLDLAEPKET